MAINFSDGGFPIFPEHELYAAKANGLEKLANPVAEKFGNVSGTVKKILSDTELAAGNALKSNPHYGNLTKLKGMGYSTSQAAEMAGLTESSAGELLDLGKLLL